MSASLQVVVDLICPWCFIGKTRLDQKLSSMPELSRPKIEWLPFELDPHMPAAGAERAAYRSRRFGSLEKSNEMDARAKAAGEQVGIEFRYERMIRTPNTFNAHRLIWLAGIQAGQREIVDAIFRAYFMEGTDIGSTSVLTDIATASGLDRQQINTFLQGTGGATEVRLLLQRAHKNNITSVPTLLRGGIPLRNGFDSLNDILRGNNS